MNHSLYIRQLEKDTNDMWLETLGCSSETAYKRAYDDQIEKEFWEKYSLIYDTIPSLYDYWPKTFDKLVDIIGTQKEVIEFGAGTGKFTLPMALKQKQVTAIDFSEDMLQKLQCKIGDLTNVHTVHGKIEDMENYNVDSIYSVNAIYRISDMKEAIKKIRSFAREKVVLVWTMQRSKYDEILNSTNKKGIFRRQEYIHIMNVLYDLGIDGNLEIMDVHKKIKIDHIQSNYEELKEIAGNYDLDADYLIDTFNQRVIEENGIIYYQWFQKVAYIYFDGCASCD
ncbi:hypothetical protein AN1V17_18660 [Vallitalea sediminicola]